MTAPRPLLPTTSRRRLGVACALALACAVPASCGKKGPPLPPLVKLPVAPADVSAKRTGDRVVVRFTIPNRSQAGLSPADIEWVEVYSWVPPPPDPNAASTSGAGAAGAAAAQLLPEQIYKYAKLVGRVQVRKPPPPPPERKEGEPPPPPPPPPTGPGLDQGTAAEVVDTLGPFDAEPIAVPVKKTKAPATVETPASSLTPPDLGPPLPPLPARLYAVVGVSHRGRRGSLSQPIRVPLWNAPPVPSSLTATIREGAVDLAWTAPDGLRHPLVVNLAPTPAASTGPARPGGGAPGAPPTGAPPPGASPDARPPRVSGDDEDEEEVLEAQARREAAMQQAAEARTQAERAQGLPAPEPVPTPQVTPSVAPGGDQPGVTAAGTASATLASRVPYPWPATSGGFNVYEVLPGNATPPPGTPPPPAVQPFPKALTAAPQKTTAFTDPRLEFGVTRCYTVRSVEGVGPLAMESASTPPACVSASDTFPPKAPASLGAVSSAGAISLIWEANSEPDLAGYLVLRAVNDGPLEQITPEPIKETTYRDAKVRSGTRYAYVVVAVDAATPPNRSAQSNRVEETVR